MTPPSSTRHTVETGPAMAGGAAGGGGAGAAGAATGSSFGLSGSTIFALPVRKRMPSLSSMVLPGTTAAATRKTFSSVTGRLRSRSAASAIARLSGAASSGSPLNGERRSCSAAIFTTSGSGGRGVAPK